MDSPDKFDWPAKQMTDAERIEFLNAQLRNLRRFTGNWHARAVAMGFEGVAHALDHLEANKATVTRLPSTVGEKNG